MKPSAIILAVFIVASCSITPVFATGNHTIKRPPDWNEPKSIALMLDQKEQDWGLPIGMAHVGAYKESRFDPKAISPDGQDRGLFQINRIWEDELVFRYFREPDGTPRTGFDWRNPEHSATVGCAYLAAMIRVHGASVYMGLVAYNWGPGHVSRMRRWEEIPKKTRDYASSSLVLLDSIGGWK